MTSTPTQLPHKSTGRLPLLASPTNSAQDRSQKTGEKAQVEGCRPGFTKNVHTQASAGSIARSVAGALADITELTPSGGRAQRGVGKARHGSEGQALEGPSALHGCSTSASNCQYKLRSKCLRSRVPAWVCRGFVNLLVRCARNMQLAASLPVKCVQENTATSCVSNKLLQTELQKTSKRHHEFPKA